MTGPAAKLRQVAIEALMARGMTRGEATVAIDKLANIGGGEQQKQQTQNRAYTKRQYTDWGKTFRVANFTQLNETENAYLFEIGDEEIWLPKSQIVEYNGSSLVITLWIAKKKGLDVQTCH